jgi:putative Mg2+ transporter-C (MgtC) family protein
VGGGMYVAAVSATVIILIILAGIKPIERRFIAVKQQRSLRILADRGSISLDTVHKALGAGSVRVKQFIVQQADEMSDLDDVQVSLSRASADDFDTICGKLRNMPGVREFRRE